MCQNKSIAKLAKFLKIPNFKHIFLNKPQDERDRMEKELQVVMRDAASLRRDFTRMSLTNNQRTVLESSTVFRETELGSFLEDSEEAGLGTALLAQVRTLPRWWEGGVHSL